jgi:hypothetical protein
LHDAALGSSTHINFDLALGLWKTIEEFGDRREGRMACYQHDHDAVNRLLAAALLEVVERLKKRYGCEVMARFTGPLLPMTGAVVLGVLGRWREHVWKDVRALVFAPNCREQPEVLKQMHQRSGGWRSSSRLGARSAACGGR